MRIGVFLLLGCVAAFTEDAPPERAADSQKSLAALKEWRAALNSVSLAFEMTERSGSKRIGEWDWSEDGSIRNHLYFTGTAEKPGSRIASLFTGGKLYSMRYAEGESDYSRRESVQISAPISGSSSLVVEPLWGLWFNHSSQWLPDAFAAETEWLGETSGRVAVRLPPRLRLELDPEYSCLPRIAQTLPGGWENIVQEFETVEPGIPFPKRGVFIQTFKIPVDGATRHEKPWEITSIRINDPATAGNFKPPIAAGTEVVDQLGETLYVQGLGLNHAQAEYRSQPAASPRASVWNRTSALVAALGVLLFVGAICWVRRQVAQ